MCTICTIIPAYLPSKTTCDIMHATVVISTMLATHKAYLTLMSYGPTSPVAFNDHLPSRARQVRFRGIGNPFEFLTSIGLVPIQEKLYRGSNIVDVAEELNIPVTYLLRWIEENNYEEDISKASTLSAEGYVSKGEKMLREATNKFELDKAKAMIEHGRFMASKKDKRTYGNQVDPHAGAAAVTYIFQVGETPPQVLEARKAREEKSIVDAEYSEVASPAVEVDVFDLNNIPVHAKQKTGVKINAAEDHHAAGEETSGHE